VIVILLVTPIIVPSGTGDTSEGPAAPLSEAVDLAPTVRQLCCSHRRVVTAIAVVRTRSARC
jgi:hypothetical protein